MQKIGMIFLREVTGGHGEPVRIYVLQRSRWETIKHLAS